MLSGNFKNKNRISKKLIYLDKLINKNIIVSNDINRLIRARLIAFASLFLAFSILSTMKLLLNLNPLYIYSFVVILIGTMVTMLFLKFYHSVSLAAFIMVGSYSISMMMFVFQGQSAMSAALVWLPIVTLLAVLFSGWQLGSFFCIFSLVGIATAYHMFSQNGQMPNNWTIEFTSKQYAIQLCFATTMCFLGGSLQEYLKRMAFSHFEHTKNQLKDKNEKMNHFVGVVAHDLRTPLGSIQNYSQLLLENEAPEDYTNYLHRINNISRQASQLVDEILDLASIRGGKINLQLRPYDCSDLIDDVIEGSKYLARKKSVSLEKKSDHIMILADPLRLYQVLNNLIVNAIKFSMPEGRVKISATSYGNYVRFEVIDQGIGMPEEISSSLFDSDHKKGRSGTAGEKSTGYGLILVNDIIEAHQSKIFVDSRVNQGSKFWFDIPVFNGKSETQPELTKKVS